MKKVSQISAYQHSNLMCESSFKHYLFHINFFFVQFQFYLSINYNNMSAHSRSSPSNDKNNFFLIFCFLFVRKVRPPRKDVFFDESYIEISFFSKIQIKCLSELESTLFFTFAPSIFLSPRVSPCLIRNSER